MSTQEEYGLLTVPLLSKEIFPWEVPKLRAAAGGAAAFADVAAARGAHLGAAGEAQRGVRGAALLELDQLGRGVRARLADGRARGGRWLVPCRLGRRRGSGSGGCLRWQGSFGMGAVLYRR
jgi:hypothetical protein